MKKKKILFLAPGLVVGGAEKFLIALINGLSSEVFDMELILLNDNNPLIDQVRKDINIKIFARKKKFDVKPIFQLKEVLKASNNDTIVFCLGLFPFFFLQLASWSIKNKFKKIISYHSTIYHSKKEEFLARLYFRMMDKYTEVITVSDNQKDYTIDHFQLKSAIFTTIHNGVDTEHWVLPPNEEVRMQIRKAYNIPSENKLIVMTAAFRQEKNHLAALRVIQQINEKFEQKVYLLLVGDGVCRKDIEATIQSLQIEKYVILAGIHTDVRPFYWSSDFFTLTSYSIETFSIAALEAMSSGLPCVLTNIGGANEMVFEQLNGYLCNPQDEDILNAWVKMLTNNFDRQTIRRIVLDKFSEAEMVKKYTTFFLK